MTLVFRWRQLGREVLPCNTNSMGNVEFDFWEEVLCRCVL
jgi:hypothetical protein